MRVVAAFLLLAVPTYAAAQTAPAAPQKPPVHKPAVLKPTAPKPTVATPAPQQPPAHTLPAHPPPTTHKPAVRKPTAHKPPLKPVPPKPTPPVAPQAPTPPATPDVHKGSNTGLPLPRYAALKTDDVNLRIGPGTRYPIEWVYKRRDLPVQIEREFEAWRLVEDPDGTKGWVQAATLTGRRTAVVAGAERVLRQSASDTASPVAKLQKGVLVRLRSCEATSDWCQVQISDYRGYIKRNEMWGVLPGEVIQ